MSYEIAVVGDLETVTGFALAGVRRGHVHERKGETLAKFDVGIIVVTYPVADELGSELEEKLRRKKLLPIVLRVPDKTGAVPEVDELSELIKRTVGTDIVVKSEES